MNGKKFNMLVLSTEEPITELCHHYSISTSLNYVSENLDPVYLSGYSTRSKRAQKRGMNMTAL